MSSAHHLSFFLLLSRPQPFYYEVYDYYYYGIICVMLGVKKNWSRNINFIKAHEAFQNKLFIFGYMS